MKKRFQPLLVILILALAAMACSLTFNTVTPASDSTETPEHPGLLPHTLYYLGTDNTGVTQVYRIEKDGKTVKQVTSEPVNVGNYGVSPVDGSVAYVVNNQIVLVNADGSNRRMLVDGGVVDENNPFLNRIHNPVFSLDGKTLAYGHHGLNFYSLADGVNNLVIEDKLDDLGNGMIIPKELYWPEKYSPDGSRLMITLGYYEGADSAFYDPASKALTRLEAAPGALICCELALWSADGTKVYSGNAAAGMFNPGLWQVDPSNGDVSTLVATDYDTNSFNMAKYPYLAPDNQLYYFFLASATGEYSRTPLQIVRSMPDGVTGRTVVREEKFDMMNEALWAPDASFVIVANATGEQVYQGGKAEIFYLDGRPNVELADFAQQMKWGP